MVTSHLYEEFLLKKIWLTDGHLWILRKVFSCLPLLVFWYLLHWTAEIRYLTLALIVKILYSPSNIYFWHNEHFYEEVQLFEILVFMKWQLYYHCQFSCLIFDIKGNFHARIVHLWIETTLATVWMKLHEPLPLQWRQIEHLHGGFSFTCYSMFDVVVIFSGFLLLLVQWIGCII